VIHTAPGRDYATDMKAAMSSDPRNKNTLAYLPPTLVLLAIKLLDHAIAKARRRGGLAPDWHRDSRGNWFHR
jgi:hypothetical protein